MEIKSEALEAKPGTKVVFPAGKLPTERSLSVEKSGKPEWGDGPSEVGFISNRKFDEFASIGFTAAGGKALESSRGGSSSMTMMGKTTAEVSYTFKQKATNSSWSFPPGPVSNQRR